MPIFDSEFVTKFNDEFLAGTESPALVAMLNSAWEMASNRYLRSRRAAQAPPRDAAPPIAGSPLGASAGARPTEMPDNDEVRTLIAQAAAIGKDRAWVEAQWKASRDEELANA